MAYYGGDGADEAESKLEQTIKLFQMTNKEVRRIEKHFNLLDKDRDSWVDVENLLRCHKFQINYTQPEMH